jgi:CRISPR-associated protein Cas1
MDAFVWSLFRERLLRVEYFTQDQGRCILNKTGRKCFYAQYEAFVHPVRRLLRLQGYQLARLFLEVERDSIL